MHSLKVMTWNVENLFLPDAGASQAEQQRFQTKLATLAAVIDREPPDVLALQEIGPDGALQALHGSLAVPMPHALAGEPDGRGIRVAFLSRLPFTGSTEIRPFPSLIQPVQQKDQIFDDPQTPEDESFTAEMGRGGLEVTFEVESTPVTILSVHFKSKLITYSRQWHLVQGSRCQPKDEGEHYRYAATALYRRTGEAMTVPRAGQPAAGPRRWIVRSRRRTRASEGRDHLRGSQR